MRWTRLAIVFGILAVGGITLAQHGHGKGVKTLSQKDITEKLDGKKAKATTVEVTLGPGQASAPHRHPGPAFGYVLEGEDEWAIDDNPSKILKARDTRPTAPPAPPPPAHPPLPPPPQKTPPTKKGKTRILAVVLHPPDVKDI